MTRSSSEKLSIFRNEPPIQENELTVLLTQLSCNFTENDRYFFTMLAKKIRDHGMSQKQLAFAVDYLLCHHRYKLKIADVFSVDELLKSYSYDEFSIATETYPHPKFGYVHLGRHRYIVKVDEAEKYGYSVTPITTEAEIKYEEEQKRKEEKSKAVSIFEYLENYHKSNDDINILEKGLNEQDVRAYLKKFRAEHPGEVSYFESYKC